MTIRRRKGLRSYGYRESDRIVWDEPGGDVIVEFEREVRNEALFLSKCQA